MADEFGPDYGQFLKELGTRIKQLRNERGLSLRDMIVIHGYADSQWRRYERGGSVNVQTLLRICNAFKISLCVLLHGLGEYPTVSVEQIKRMQQPEMAALGDEKKGRAHKPASGVPKAKYSSPTSVPSKARRTESGKADFKG
jgi:transcriptional regulator with XRE-family HTH domain